MTELDLTLPMNINNKHILDKWNGQEDKDIYKFQKFLENEVILNIKGLYILQYGIINTNRFSLNCIIKLVFISYSFGGLLY